MAMKPLAFEADGKVNVRASVPLNIWGVLVKVGRDHAELVSRRRISDEHAGVAGMQLLLRHIARLVEDGDTKWLTPEFQEALRKLQDNNFGTLPIDGAAIDISMLHRSSKLKSGFVGIYANGQGFRAVSKDFAGKAIAIGTFKTAEEAAYRRRLYHLANNLAYGELEDEMEAWRKNTVKHSVHAGISDEGLIAAIKQALTDAGTWDHVFGPTCVSFEPKRSTKLPRRDDALAKPKALAKLAPLALAAPVEPELGEPEPVDHHQNGADSCACGNVWPCEYAEPIDVPMPVVAIGFEDGDLPESLQ